MKKVFIAILAILLLSSVILVGCPADDTPPPPPPPPPTDDGEPPPPPAETYTFEAVSFQPKGMKGVEPMQMYADSVAEMSNGQIIIDWIGGPDIVPGREQHQAVKDGVIDIALNRAHAYRGEIPETMILPMSEVPAWVERERGMYEYMNERHKDTWNTVWLGRTKWLDPFYTVVKTSRAINTPTDLAGLQVSTPPFTEDILTKIGMVPFDIEEEYTGMERGTIDAVCTPPGSMAADGLFEIATHLIDHPINSGSIVLTMNQAKFESLPPELQDLMFQALWSMEPDLVAFYDDYRAGGFQTARDEGVEIVQFWPADAAWFDELIHATNLAGMEDSLDATQLANMKKFILK